MSIAVLVLVLATAVVVTGYRFFLSDDAVEEARDAAYLQQGIDLYNQKRYRESLQVLANIGENTLVGWQAPYYQGAAQMMLRDYDSAVVSLEKALALDNQQTGVLYALGVVYYKLGNTSLARGYFAAVLDIDPTDEQAKGLMDIMARVERGEQANPPQADAAGHH